MIQRLLTKYALAFHVAGVCLFPVFCLGQPRVFGYIPLLWLSLVAIEVMFLLPSVRRSETLAYARRRALKVSAWDPFLYMGITLVGMAAVQWLNSGCELIYLTDADVWQLSKPPVSWAPFSVEPRAAFTQVSVFTACVTVGVILRAALSKTSKRLLLQVLAGASGCAALFSVVQACQKIQPFLSQTSGLEASAMGTFFGFWLLLGMGLFVDALSRGQRGCGLLYGFGFAGNLLGMFFFASALALTVYVFLACLLFFYWMVYLSPHVPKAVQLKLFLATLFLVSAAAVACVYLYPKNPVMDKLKAALPVTEYWSALSTRNKIRAEAAMAVWQEHPWVGVGADGFYHYVGQSVQTKDWAVIKNDQAYVYNDGLQFLCEYGVFGAGLLAALVITLLVPVCYRSRNLWENKLTDADGGRLFLLRLSPIVVTGVLATAVCFLESWFSSPFRSAGLLLAWTCVMASMPAFLPAPARGGRQG